MDIYVITWSQDSCDEHAHSIVAGTMAPDTAAQYLIESSGIDLRDIYADHGYARIDRVSLSLSVRYGDEVHLDSVATLSWDMTGNPYWR
jgi:hypothetical protein